MTDVSKPEEILVISNDPRVVTLVTHHLRNAGYQLTTASLGADAIETTRHRQFTLIILDSVLPDASGIDVFGTLRSDNANGGVPILLLTAQRDELDHVHGWTLGIDDFLTKPLTPSRLELRVAAMLRRTRFTADRSESRIVLGPLHIDRAAVTVQVNGESIELTTTEFKLLLTLAEGRGRVHSRARLLEEVWDAAPDVQTRTVDMHIQRLRAKLGAAGAVIETVRGFGYCIPSPGT